MTAFNKNSQENNLLYGTNDIRGKSDYLKSMFKKYHAENIEANPGIHVPDTYAHIRDWLIKNNQDEPKTPAYQAHFAWITINASKEVDPYLLYSRCLTLKKQWMETWMACLEFHTESGNHPHVHLLAKKKQGYMDKAKSQIINEFFSTFRDLCGTKEAIHVRLVTDPASQIEYIYGNKIVLDKIPFVQKDDELRLKLNIPRVYGPWVVSNSSAGANGAIATDSSYLAPQVLQSGVRILGRPRVCPKCEVELEKCSCDYVEFVDDPTVSKSEDYDSDDVFYEDTGDEESDSFEDADPKFAPKRKIY